MMKKILKKNLKKNQITYVFIKKRKSYLFIDL